MSSPIGLTASDDEILSSRLRSRGKQRALVDLVDGGETPTKRMQRPSGSSSGPTSFGGSRHAHPIASHILDPWRDGRTPIQEPPQTTDSQRSVTPRTPDDSEDENGSDEAFEIEEITRVEFEQAAHRQVAKEPPPGHRLVEFAPVNGHRLEPGNSIELKDNDFLRIVYLFWDTTKSKATIDSYILRGILLRRNLKMGGMFPATVNEVVAIIAMPVEDQRPPLIAGLQDRALTEFVRIREIRFTNAGGTEFSFREDENQPRWQYFDLEENKFKQNNAVISKEARLICRYKSVECWRPNLKLHSQACLRLDPDEADDLYRLTNVQLIRRWFLETRGRSDGGSSKNTAIKGGMIDLYCGGGGASEAARLAGFTVSVAVDNKECAVSSHQRNHPYCMTIHSDVFDVVNSPTGVGYIICDLCHSSCPCRFWSPLHTVHGKHDEANEAAAFMVQTAAKKLSPRIMSFEQTPGFFRIKRHRPQWSAFIQQFTSMGFSVKWKTVNFADLGGPKRERLWIIASCPGQQMPKDVQPTHGSARPGLHPHATVREIVSSIPAGATMHDPQEQAEKYRRTGKPSLPTAEWDKPFPHLIARAGPKLLHPEIRPFTVREAMNIQGFPPGYDYVGQDGGEPTRTEAMGMLGDAVPPKPAVPLFSSILEALHITDQEIAAHKDQAIEAVFAHREEVIAVGD